MLNDAIGRVEAKFSGFTQVFDAARPVVLFQIGHAAVVIGLGQASIVLDGERIMSDGFVVCTLRSIEIGTVEIEISIVPLQGDGL